MVLQHGLPPITFLESIDSLNQDQLLAFLRGYGLAVPDSPNILKQALLRVFFGHRLIIRYIGHTISVQ